MAVSDPANPTHAGEVVMDGDAHTEMMIMPQQKQYMLIPQSMMDAMKDRADSGVKFTFSKTGRTETVAGVSCQVVHVSGTKAGKPQEGDMCVAKGVGFDPAAWSSMGGRSGAGGEMAQVRAAVGPGNGIMKIVTTERGEAAVQHGSHESRPLAGERRCVHPAGGVHADADARRGRRRTAVEGERA